MTITQYQPESDITNSNGKPTPTCATTREGHVGITLFVNKNVSGFNGEMKKRYSDFLVNEISLKGQVIRIAQLAPLKESQEQQQQQQIEQDDLTKDSVVTENNKELQEQAALEEADLDVKKEDALKKLEEMDVVDEESVKKIRELVLETEGDFQTVEILSKAMNDKIKRTELHQLFKSECFASKCSTRTDDGGKVRIRISSRPQNTDNRNTKKRKRGDYNDWPETGDFCLFHLLKENKDLSDAINIIAKKLHVQPKAFTYAGTKDKRGVTVQQVTAYRIKQEKLLALNKFLRGLKIGDTRYVKERLELGDLNGNRFSIAVRDLNVEDPKSIRQAVESFKQNGFINYFGLQRFGTRATMTYHIGMSLLQQKWKEAVEKLLLPSTYIHISDTETTTTTISNNTPKDSNSKLIEEREDILKARNHWKDTRDAKATLDLFPRFAIAERSVLTFLSNSGNQDYFSALLAIPRNMRSMYLHSYQSYVWNHMVTRRIEMYGFKPVIGDVAQISLETQRSSPTSETKHVDKKSKTSNEQKDNQNSKEKEKEDELEELEDEKFNKGSYYIIETQEQLEKVSFHDIVLPLPGFDILYPKNSMFEEYKTFMKKDGLCPLKMKLPQKQMSLPGGYRRILGKAKNVEYEIQKYTDQNQPLFENKMDRFQHEKRAHAEQQNTHHCQDAQNVDGHETSEQDTEKKRALCISFDLETSQYATMAMREVMKSGDLSL